MATDKTGSQIDLPDGNLRDSIPRVRATSPEGRIGFGRHGYAAHSIIALRKRMNSHSLNENA
jgi:hypothetical protein